MAARPIEFGELLLATQPLAFLSHPHGQDELPDPALLVPQLVGRGPAASWTAAWLRELHKGSLHGGATAADLDLSKLRLLLRSEKFSFPNTPGCTVDEKDAQAVVSYNAFGEQYDDPVAAAASSSSGGSSPSPAGGGHVGLWPHFALLNHSCLPNAVNYTIGR